MGRFKIDYITVTTFASGLVCMDGQENAIGKALMVFYKRTDKEAEYIGNLPEFVKVKESTGLEMSESLMLPKILWIKNESIR